ncbi:NAD-dependent epimerase/dehydratase family protein [Pseudoxanthomonas sacheonensis]|uniref:UDP-glucose 4-epimerase n=1 Tax=Pseudoxanthomonas sacheonensis TaxID=443615 RepID=A0ABU1RWF4_9GAMM|nr:NAD-dependent epimerase/dehydratase family protein [Pseudoxanthomonas sacheonensis]MDR6843113.1 UDP-glucose 4-epimerase [Pseudoxanthomonas sacheonensis]
MSDAVLILGAGGFIGRHLAESLASDGRRVIAATRRPEGFANPLIANVVSAFSTRNDFAELLEDCTHIIHAASSSTPGSSATQPQLDGNLRTTLALIEALQKFPSRRLLFLSSGGTLYGDREKPVIESDQLLPRSYHGAGKAASEHFIHAWTSQYDGTAIVLRPSNVYGPGQVARAGFGIIPAAFDCALNRTTLTIWGDGASVRDYLYIDDLLHACRLALVKSIGTGTHTFNVANGEPITLNALLDNIDAITGTPVPRSYNAMRSSDIRSISLDISAARDSMDWRPTTPLATGLERTWRWHAMQARE